MDMMSWYQLQSMDTPALTLPPIEPVPCKPRRYCVTTWLGGRVHRTHLLFPGPQWPESMGTAALSTVVLQQSPSCYDVSILGCWVLAKLATNESIYAQFIDYWMNGWVAYFKCFACHYMEIHLVMVCILTGLYNRGTSWQTEKGFTLGAVLCSSNV